MLVDLVSGILARANTHRQPTDRDHLGAMKDSISGTVSTAVGSSGVTFSLFDPDRCILARLHFNTEQWGKVTSMSGSTPVEVQLLAPTLEKHLVRLVPAKGEILGGFAPAVVSVDGMHPHRCTESIEHGTRSPTEEGRFAGAWKALNDQSRTHLAYLNLHRSQDLTAKVYLIDPAIVQHQPSGYLVNPHDHAYRFHTLVAAGECTNYTFKVDGWHDYDHYEFHSAMNGPAKIVTRGTCGLVPMSRQIMQPGEGYYCDERTIHTISVHPRKTTVLFLLQYKDIRTPTNLYTRESTPPSLDGLYERMTPEKVCHFADLARVLIDDAKQGG